MADRRATPRLRRLAPWAALGTLVLVLAGPGPSSCHAHPPRAADFANTDLGRRASGSPGVRSDGDRIAPASCGGSMDGPEDSTPEAANDRACLEDDPGRDAWDAIVALVACPRPGMVVATGSRGGPATLRTRWLSPDRRGVGS